MDRIFLMLVAGLLVFGCAEPTQTTPGPSSSDVTPAQPAGDTAANETQDDTAQPADATPDETGQTQPPQTGGNEVLILGRSVAYAWMEYLGAEYVCQDTDCNTGTLETTHNGYELVYSEIDIPPEVASSAAMRVDSYGDDADIVFFKLCFADFESDPSGENLARNKKYVEDAYDEIVTKRGKKLIVGNALPMVAEYTDSDLVSNHKSYNQWLDSFASANGNVEVLDLYGILADSSGNLKSEYAIDPYDSHLNDAAYAKITPEFMQLLD